MQLLTDKHINSKESDSVAEEEEDLPGSSVDLSFEEENGDDAVSRGSTEHDVSMILNHSICSEEDFMPDMKKRLDTEDYVEKNHSKIYYGKKPDYDSYEASV